MDQEFVRDQGEGMYTKKLQRENSMTSYEDINWWFMIGLTLLYVKVIVCDD